MVLLTTSAGLKLVQTAIKLVGAAIKAQKGELADLFDVAGETVEFASGLTDAQRVTVANTAARVQKRLERNWQNMLECESADWALRADVQAVFLRLADVLDAALPNAAAIVAANLETTRIATLVADKAATMDSLFADGQVGRRVLTQLVTIAYDEAKCDEKFVDKLRLPIEEELLRRTEQQATKTDVADLAELLGQIAAQVGTESGVPLPVIREILAAFGEPEDAPEVGQIEQRLRVKAKEYQDLRDRLNSLTNDDPRVQALRREAMSLIDKGGFDSADAKLSQAEEIDLAAIDELEGFTDRRRASAAASRAERGAAAELILDYIRAAGHFDEAALLVTRDENAAWNYRMRQASALARRGQEFGDNTALHDAIAVWSEALRVTSIERTPLQRAATQNNLGTALGKLGAREISTARLEQAVAAFHEALLGFTRERAPMHWAATQNNIGNALWILGGRESGTVRLEEAVAAYHSALQEWTRERVPLQWAATQNNLGNVLSTLGERESSTLRLKEAEVAYRNALFESTVDLVPLEWATAQHNLSTTLSALAERECSTIRLEEAVAGYRDALQVRTRGRVPLDWATTQNNLAAALCRLGEWESDPTRLQEAVVAYGDALQERRRERVPLEWASTRNNLGNALVILGTWESGTLRLKEAVTAYRDALQEWTRERAPLNWAVAQNNLGNALRILGERKSSTALLKDAVVAFRDALQERTQERVPLDWATTQKNLGGALYALGVRESGTATLKEAVLAWSECVTGTASTWPLDWVESVRLKRATAHAEICRRMVKW